MILSKDSNPLSQKTLLLIEENMSILIIMKGTKKAHPGHIGVVAKGAFLSEGHRSQATESRQLFQPAKNMLLSTSARKLRAVTLIPIFTSKSSRLTKSTNTQRANRNSSMSLNGLQSPQSITRPRPLSRTKTPQLSALATTLILRSH